LLFVGLLLLAVLLVAPTGFVGLIARFVPPRRSDGAAQASCDVTLFLSRGAGASLSVSGLSVRFGGVRAVSDLSFEAKPGEVTSIIGPNGAGKSTVLNLIGGFSVADSGTVRLGERNITGLASNRVAREGLARTYQTTQLFSNMPV